MTSKRELIEQFDWYRGEYYALKERNKQLIEALQRDSVKIMDIESKVTIAEAEQYATELRGAEPYVRLAEDLLTLIPDLGIYVSYGVWDFAEVSRAAEHKRGKTALDQFETLVN